MIEFLVFGALLAAGLGIAALLGFVFLLIKLVLWAVLLPFRLLLKVLMIPVWLTLGGVALALGTLALPVLLVVLAAVAVVGIVGTVLALLLPSIPFVLLGLLLWAVFRRTPQVA